ncbi:MAG: hypothetical protein Kow0042_14280 [Calditrichia bacterium]
MKNPYKRLDIFACVHESHRNFKNRISAYHILKEKGCYPQGCFYFRWKCKQLSKRSRCHRGFSHVGRKCDGCRYFVEEKVHNYPELKISREEYDEFIKSVEDFEEWISEIQHREIEIAGTVNSVKPHFKKKIYPKARYLSFRGYLLAFKEIYLNQTHFQDPIYLLVSSRYYHQLRVGRGDQIEGRCRLKLDRGRPILYYPRGVQIISRGEPAIWNDQQVIVARETATTFPEQPEECMQCPFGALLDVEYHKDQHAHPQRELMCLKGIQDYKNCYVTVEYCGQDREARETLQEACEKYGKIFIPKS